MSKAISEPGRSRGIAASPRIAAALSAVLLLLAGSQPTSAAGDRLFLPYAETPTIGRVAPVEASHPRGLHAGPLSVTLRSGTPGAEIRYTTDGRWPSPTTGEHYQRPLSIDQPTVLRAAAFHPRRTPSPVRTWSYILPERVLEQQARTEDLPTTWGHYGESHLQGQTVPADYALDGRVADAERLGAALRALPTLSLALPPEELFGSERGLFVHPRGRGDAWERRVSVEWVPVAGSGEPGFHVTAGLRVAGNASRKHVATPKKSLSLRFRTRHGPAILEAALFPEARVRRFNTLRLRAVFNDSFLYVPRRGQYLRDRFARDSQRAMGMLAPRSRFAHLFLNGLYWGVYDVGEEPTAAFMVEHRGGQRDDWDVIEPQVDGEDGVEDGTRAAFSALERARDRSGPAGIEAIHRLLDVQAYVDFTVLSLFLANGEIGDNWRAARRRGASPSSGFVFFAWDYEGVLDLLPPLHRFYDPQRRLDVSDTAGVIGLHGRLARDEGYRRLVGDRAHRHLSDGGALSSARATQRYQRLADALEAAIVAESARWGDASPRPLAIAHGDEAWRDFWASEGEGHPQGREDEWQPEVRRLLEQILPARPAEVVVQLCRRGLYPQVAAPQLDVHDRGERVEAVFGRTGDPLRCPGAPTGVTWYTLDGSDPRAADGSFAPSARPAGDSIELPAAARLVRLHARARSGSQWSALVTRDLGLPRITIDEIHYHPPEGAAELVELWNHEPIAVDLSGWRLGGVGLTVPEGISISAGGRLVLTDDPERLAGVRDGDLPTVAYPGRLSNGGERLRLERPDGQLVHQVTYDNADFWPSSADGRGHSLVAAADRLRDGTGPRTWSADPSRWRGSLLPGGSPGAADPPQPGRVVIHELLADAPPARRAIELHAPDVGADVGGWTLAEGPDAPDAARLPRGLTIPAGGRLVVARHALLGLGPGTALLHPEGGTLELRPRGPDARRTGDARGVSYGAHGSGVSWGRVETPAGPFFAALREPTLGGPAAPAPRPPTSPGAPNADPRVGPVVLAELLVRPGEGLDDHADEFIELLNAGPETVVLAPALGQSGPGWALVDGVELSFPPGARLEPGGRLLVVGGSPSAFRSRHAVPSAVPVLGPWAGRLANEGERVALSRPGTGAARVVVDEVRYGPEAPWPAAVSDGSGHALARIAPRRFGGDPRAWRAAVDGGTPGLRLPAEVTGPERGPHAMRGKAVGSEARTTIAAPEPAVMVPSISGRMEIYNRRHRAR